MAEAAQDEEPAAAGTHRDVGPAVATVGRAARRPARRSSSRGVGHGLGNRTRSGGVRLGDGIQDVHESAVGEYLHVVGQSAFGVGGRRLALFGWHFSAMHQIMRNMYSRRGLMVKRIILWRSSFCMCGEISPKTCKPDESR